MRKHDFEDRTSKYAKDHRQKHRRHYFMRGVSALVVFCTVYSLILPAISMEQKAFCGLEEHKHSEACYESGLICGYTETTPVEMLPATAATGETLPDTTVAGEAQPEATGEALQPEATVPVQAHVHTDACYEQVLACEKQEHTHALSCYADPNADVESADVWARSVSGVALSGDWAEDLVAIAESQLGYRESEKNYQVADDSVTIKGYTRYGAWYGDPYGDWSGMFAAFCLNYAGIPQSAVPQESDCARWVQTLSRHGLYHASDYEPVRGDLVFFDRDGDGASDHVGLITEATKDGSGHVTQIKTVEGDSANCVQRGSYNLSQSVLSGFASLPENPNAPAPTVPETTAETDPETTVETVPEASITETVGNMHSAHPSETPSAELQAVGNGATLKLNEPMDVTVAAGEIVKIPFTPTYTHSYVFESELTDYETTYGYLYDASGKQLKYQTYGGDKWNFRFTYTLTAGTLYYFGVRSSNSGTIPVRLTLGTHNITKNDAGEFVCACGERVLAGLELDKQMDVDVVAGKTVMLQFTPTLTHQYVFESKFADNTDTYGYLYDATGKSLTSNDDGAGNGQFRITYTLTAGTTYFFGVKYENTSESGTVPVLLTLGAVHQFNENDAGEFVCACGGRPITGLELDKQMDVDVAAGKTVMIQFTPTFTHEYAFESTGSGDTYGYLYNASGSQITYSDDAAGNGQFRITYTLTAGTTYFFGVKYKSTSESGTIPVLLTLGKHKFTGNDAGDFACACGERALTGLELDKQMNVDVAAGKTVMIQFTPTYTHEYVFQLLGEADVYVYLYDASGKLITSNYGAGFSLTYSLTAETAYCFGIEYKSSTVSGTIPVRLTQGNHSFRKNAAGAFSCDCGAVMANELELNTEAGLYVSKGETVKIPFTPTYTHEYIFESTGSADAYGYLYDSSGNELDADNDSGGNGRFKIAYRLTAGTAYYFGVSYYSNNNSGTIPVRLTLGPTHHYNTENDEGNLVCDCGKVIRVERGLELGKQMDVEVAAGETVRIPFTPTYTHEYVFQSLGDADVYGYLCDASGTQLTSSSGTDFSITYTLTAGTAYYFGIRYWSSSNSGTIPVRLTGDHSFKTNAAGALICECGAVMANGLELNKKVGLSVFKGETVKIPFTPTYTHGYVFESTGSADAYGYLYDASGKELDADNDSGGNGQFKITYTLTAGETYYFGVKYNSSSNSGTISVLLTLGTHQYKENEEGVFVCVCEARALAGLELEKPMDVEIAAGETVRIPLKPTLTHEYVFKPAGEMPNTRAVLYDESGKQLASSGGYYDVFNIIYTLTAGMTYYLDVGFSASRDSGTIPVLLTWGTHQYKENDEGNLTCDCGSVLHTVSGLELDKQMDVVLAENEVIKISFKPTYTHEYVFQLSGDADVYVHLYDADGNQLTSSSGTDFGIDYNLSRGPMYYFEVGYTSSTVSGTIPVRLTLGEHSFKKSDTGGSFICDCGARMANRLELNKKVDLYVFKNETVKIPFTPTYTHEYVFKSVDGASFTGKLYDADGNQLTSRSGTNFSLAYTLTAGTLYYFGVTYGDRITYGTLSVLLSLGKHTYHDIGSGRMTCDCGLKVYTESGLEPDKPMDVQIPAQNMARFPFTPTVNHEYIFEIQSDAYTLCLFDASFNLLSESTPSGNGSNCRITYNLNAYSTYYFGIKNDSSSDSGTIPVQLSLGEHSFDTISDTKVVCRCGTELPTLNGLMPGEPMDAPVDGQNMVYLPFNPTWNHLYTFEATADALIEIQLYNAYGYDRGEIASDSTYSVTEKAVISKELIGGRSYALGIRYRSNDDSGTISVSLIPVHRYTKIENGKVICTCGQEAGSADALRLADQTDLGVMGTTVVYYPFIPTVTHQYVFNFLNLPRAYGYLYDSSGNLIASDTSGASKITQDLTADTTYFFGVRHAYEDNTTSIEIEFSLSLGEHRYHLNEAGEAICDCGYTPPTSGDCGNGTFWRYADGVLTIFGSGAVPDFSNTTIPWYYYKDQINSLVLEDGVTSVGNAFVNHDRLTDVTIQGATAINSYAFGGCTGLTSITFEAGGSIGYATFRDSPNLTSVTLKGDVRIGNYAFSNCDKLTDLTLSDGLTSISIYAFHDCDSLTSVTIPGSVTSIGEQAFSSCNSLTDVVIQDGLKSIGVYAFAKCNNLTNVTIPNSVTSIGRSAFSACGLTSLPIPDSISIIEDGVFSSCDFTSLIIPDHVTSIGNGAFKWCDALTSVTIPGSVTSIGDEVFSECKKLTSVTLADGLTSIGARAFSYSGLTSITIPSSVTSFGFYPFGDCDNLTTIAFQEGTTSIRSYALSKCNNLTSIVIPDSVTTIEGNVLSSSHIASFTITENITSIEQYAFSGSSIETLYWNAKGPVSLAAQSNRGSVKKVIVGKSADMFLGEYLTQLVNTGCTELEFEKPQYISLNALNADFTGLPMSIFPESRYYIDSTGIFYRISESGEAYVAYCPPEAENVIIPGSIPGENDGETFPVVGVDSYAFVQSPISELIFAEPEKIQVLGDLAFYGAKNLASVNGKTTDTEILEAMNHPREGALLFVGTKIASAVTVTNAPLRVTKNNVDLTITTSAGGKHPAAAEGDNTFLNYTGETTKSIVTLYGHTTASDTNAFARIFYFRSNDEGSFNYEPGDYAVTSKQGTKYTMRIFETGIPNCCCVELQCPNPGDTYSIDFTWLFPSPESGGGTLTVWGGILTAAENAELGTAMLPTKTIHLVKWETVADDFPVRKTGPRNLAIASDENGGAIVKAFTYSISMSRSGSTLEGIGKDHVTSVDFEDTFTLPEGAEFPEDMRTKIQNNSYEGWSTSTNAYYFMPGHIKFMEIEVSGSTMGETPSLSINDQGQLIIRWTAINHDYNTEISNLFYQVTLYDGSVIISQPRMGSYTFENRITATQHYMYSADRVKEASCFSSASVPPGRLTLLKAISEAANRMGESVTFTLTAKNSGFAIYEHLATLRDEMDEGLYLSAEQIATLFANDPAHDLTIAIHSATLCATVEKQTFTGINGYSQAIPPFQNIGVATDYSGMSTSDPDCLRTDVEITLAWTETNQIQISVVDGGTIVCNPTASAIQSSLDSIGFLITPGCRYALTWDLTDESGTPPILKGNQRIEKSFTATVKDSFMALNQDKRNMYSSSSGHHELAFTNDLYAYDKDGNLLDSCSVSDKVDTDFSLSKGWSTGSQAVTEKSPLSQWSVLDYALHVDHYGSGKYNALPLVDHMSGAQALLVNKSWNWSEEWAASCPTVSVDGTEYYILREPGTYSRVWTTQTQMADTVTVTASDSGLDTIIKWYFVDYRGDRTNTVTYQSMVCPLYIAPDALSFTLWNQTWLSDHTTHRLYDDLYDNLPGLHYRTFSFDKKIVQSVGDTSPGETYSMIHEGDTVFYRLSLTSYRNDDGEYVPLTMTGRDLYDLLPGSVADFRWSKDNIRIDYEIDPESGSRVTNGDSWSVTEAKNDLQRIQWGDDFSITFQGTVNIYVTLTYPTGDAWQSYAAQYGAEILQNTFHALTDQVSVIHDLSVPVSARIQKGVYSSGGQRDNADVRFHYCNDAQIQYYISVYNGGVGRLYLTEIWDRLPKGFTWHGKGSNSGIASVYCANGDSSYCIPVDYYSITTSTAKDGTQLLRFRFYQDSLDWDPYDDSHDDTMRGLCFLKPGESIVFSYVCNTGNADTTTARALNTVSMPYYDYTGQGVTLDTGSTTVAANSATYTPNDGGCTLEGNSQALGSGFTGGTSDTQWLTSEVTVTRVPGVIKVIRPGITKALTSATNFKGEVTRNPASVNSLDLLTWTVTAENDGTDRIADYVLTDVMQAPYMFTGEVSFKISNQSSSYSFTISKTDNPDKLKIDTKTLTIGGDPVELLYGSNAEHSVWVSISRDADGNAVMSLRMLSDYFAIPAGGRVELTLNTKNPTNVLENNQFLNTCFITPLSQSWDGRTNKGNVVDLETPFHEGALPSVRNSAPVTTAFGYITSSEKQVTEVEHPENTAASKSTPNFIVLERNDSLFRYTLSVDNTAEQSMENLILIDSLPEPNDHTVFLENDLRFSDFKVSLTDNPDFTLTVTDSATGSSTVLSPDKYSIQYSTQRKFTDSDWNGTSTWDGTPGEARSLRLVIKDPTGVLIPKKSTVSLSFNCKVDGDAEPGQIAWNSFGYHNNLVGETAELESAPLKVGVKVPTVPMLQKQLADHAGQPILAETDQTFAFLIYQGEPLEDTYETKAELLNAIGEAARAYQEFSLTVPAGQSASDAIFLRASGWVWANGQKYTLVELPSGKEYGLYGFDGSERTAYSFIYNKAEDKVITCENTGLRWSVELVKTNTDDEILPGAVFALYSPAAEDLISVPTAYASLNVPTEIDRNGSRWYLKAVGTTDDAGKLYWDSLYQEKYYLAEIKAPDGYNLPGDGWLLESKNETQGLYTIGIVNTASHALPMTGGSGTTLYTAGGALLMACAGMLLLYSKKKRRKEDIASS